MTGWGIFPAKTGLAGICLIKTGLANTYQVELFAKTGLADTDPMKLFAKTGLADTDQMEFSG